MTSYERVMTAMERGQPDRVPILEWVIHTDVMRRICPEAATQTDFEVRMDFDAVCAGTNYPKVREEADGTYYDEWGVRYAPSSEMQDHPVEAPIQTPEDLRKYTPPDPDAPHRLGDLPDLVKRFKHKKAIVFIQRAAFMHSVALRGFEDLLVDFLAEPEFAGDVLDVVAETNIRLAHNAIKAGADIIVLSDDYAGNDTTFFSPAVFRKLVLPRLQRVVDAIHAEGAKVVKHSDGNLWPILDEIVDTGIDAINPIEPVAGMDIGDVKQKYGDRVCLVGNVDCSYILSEASTDEVTEVVAECIRKGSPGGGHIIASSNCIHSAVKPENYLAMIRATKEFGEYPIV
jgi:uroporphyrinogen decarboxylase